MSRSPRVLVLDDGLELLVYDEDGGVTLEAFRSRSVADPVMGVTTDAKRIGELFSTLRFRTTEDLIARLRSELGGGGKTKKSP